MEAIAAIAGVLLIGLVLWDAFETIVLPRRVQRRLTLTQVIYRLTWRPWAALARRLPAGQQRETYLGFYGPLSLLLLLAIWSSALVCGFAGLLWWLGIARAGQAEPSSFATALYASGTTFFTLGLGDVTPRTPAARAATVVEVGTGFGFLALMIGFIPAFHQKFAERELDVGLLDARAGSPPTALEFFRRNMDGGDVRAVERFLQEWEVWAARLLESHLSYPPLAYFRSQHDNQSWLGALAMILDVSALALAGIEGLSRSARFTFAIGRHAAADLSQVFNTPPRGEPTDRLPPDQARQLCEGLAAAGVRILEPERFQKRLGVLRAQYEPFLVALADYLLMPLPAWIPAADAHDNWEVTAWGALDRDNLVIVEPDHAPGHAEAGSGSVTIR